MGNKFNSSKKREEIQFQKKSKKLTMFMSFWHFFPVVFYEFLPYVSSYLSNLTSFTQSHANHWKVFWNFITPNSYVKMEKSSALLAIWNVSWRFSWVLAWKEREEITLSGKTLSGENDEFLKSDENFARRIMSPSKIIKICLNYLFPS